LRGDDTAPLLEDTIAGLLARTAAARPGAEALVFREHGLRLSWREFAQAVDRLATGLLALGVGRGDRVGIWSPNRPEWVLTQFATARIGAILVNVNPAYRLAEVEYALRHVGVRVLVTADRFKSSDYVGMLQDLLPPPPASGAFSAANLPDLRWIIAMGKPVPGMLRFADIAATAADSARLDALTAALDANDPINIQFTSGTTGQPKGATLSHRNIVNNANFVTARMGFGDQDRLCIPVPLYHCFGMVMGVLGCVTKGATMIFPAEAFDPDVTLETVAEERCTALYGVPTMFSAMLASERFHHHDLSTLRTGIMAGAPCPIEVMKRVRAEMHMSQVTIAYGMTETSPVSFQSMTDDPVEKRVSTVGRIHPGLEVKLVDASGHSVATGAVGELCTRGYSVMRGYWNEPQKTAEAIDAEGWMHSGDLATIDAEGYCSIVGRSKDMLIRGGENVYPREIEEFLYRHPKVREVQVIGIPDDRYGEEICACVMARDPSLTAEELRAFCKGQIAHYKVPRYVEFVDAFPMTVTGKVQKFILRDQMLVRIFPEAAAD
jgi:fatty-acyl-CoA synthase